MRKPFKQCILHIGTEKTGSSSIQAFLDINRTSLSKEGVLYPTTNVVGSQWEFVALVHSSPWDNDIGQRLNITDEPSHIKFKQLFLENFKQQVAANPKCSTLLISSEHFHSRLHNEKVISNLKRILHPFVESFKVIVYFRRQDELAVSHLTTRIKSGFPGSDTFLPSSDSPSPFYNYDALVERWAAVFGLERLTAGLYDEAIDSENGILNDFCRKAQISLQNKSIPQWQNQSVSAEGLRFIQSLNHLYTNQEGILSARDKHELILLVSRQNPGKFIPLSKARAQQFYTQFEACNQRLQELLFPNRTGPLFHNDFSQYPDEAETLPHNYDDAVMQAVKIWQETKPPQRLLGFARKVKRFVKNSRL